MRKYLVLAGCRHQSRHIVVVVVVATSPDFVVAVRTHVTRVLLRVLLQLRTLYRLWPLPTIVLSHCLPPPSSVSLR